MEAGKKEGTFDARSLACRILLAPKKAIITAKIIIASLVEIRFFILLIFDRNSSMKVIEIFLKRVDGFLFATISDFFSPN
jgi:hypothetical protein